MRWTRPVLTPVLLGLAVAAGALRLPGPTAALTAAVVLLLASGAWRAIRMRLRRRR